MKKIYSLIFVTIIVFSTTMFAQNLSLGIKAGLNLSNVISKDDDITYSEDLNMLIGFHANPFIEYSFSNLFFIRRWYLIAI